MNLFGTAPEFQTGAVISDCGVFRYHLYRVWDVTLPRMAFVMVNPSTADETEDDATIRRCVGFAKRERCGGISVRNVFAYRDKVKKNLLKVADPFGPENERHLAAVVSEPPGSILVVAWGTRLGGKKLAKHYDRTKKVLRMLSPFCLGVTAEGEPKHPLYLAGDAALVPWKVPG